jgi:hypothetical protein
MISCNILFSSTIKEMNCYIAPYCGYSVLTMSGGLLGERTDAEG